MLQFPGKANICKNQRKSANLAPFVLFSLSLLVPLENTHIKNEGAPSVALNSLCEWPLLLSFPGEGAPHIANFKVGTWWGPKWGDVRCVSLCLCAIFCSWGKAFQRSHVHVSFARLAPSIRGLTKGWFSKGWFWRMFPRNETGTRVHSDVPPERGYVRMFPQNENRNEVHSPKPPFYETTFVSQWTIFNKGHKKICAVDSSAMTRKPYTIRSGLA